MKLVLRKISALAIGSGSFFSLAQAEPIFSTRVNDKAPHVRVGVSVRKIGVDFEISPSTTFSSSFRGRSGKRTRTSGPGDVGLFQGGDGTITYGNGSVGGETVFDSGSAFTTISSANQLSDPGRSLPSGFDFPLQQVEFTSSGREVKTNSIANPISNSIRNGSFKYEDDEIVVGPYVELVFPCLEGPDDRFLNFVVGYSFFNSSHGTGDRNIGNLRFQNTTTTTDTVYTYRYDYVGDAGSQSGGGFPYDGAGAIFDIEAFQQDVLGQPADLEAPSKTAQSTTSVNNNGPVINLVGFSKTNVNIDLHEIPLGFECGQPIGKGTLALRGGATVNIVEIGVYNQTDWFQRGVSAPVVSEVFRSSDSTVKMGGFLGTNYTRPVSADGRLYFEAHVSYRWVDSIQASAGNASFEVDLSSWEGGIGFGYVF